MSRGSFVFTPTALRSLELDEDMLERYKYKKQLACHHLNSYMVRKEVRDRTQLRSGAAQPAAVCQDVIVQNALYTGDLEAMQHLFPRGSTANLVIEPQGGDMCWVAAGEEQLLNAKALSIDYRALAKSVGKGHATPAVTGSQTTALPSSPGETNRLRDFKNLVSSGMAYIAPQVKWRKPKTYRNDVIATAKATGSVLQFWNSLLVGDELTILSIVDDEEYDYLINAIYDTSNIEEWKNFRFNYRCLRLWSLSYQQELTTPLHITAGRGFTDCLRLLLQRGANVDLAPGGITALHESCENFQPECTKLLLIHGANANAVSEDGIMPLHVCASPESLECAKYLLQYGAAINGRTTDEDETPLHVAARNGLPGHIELYLRYGAAVDKQNNEGLTPLNAACAQSQEVQDLQRYFKVCQILLGAGADVHTMDQDRHTPLHMACKNANPDIVDLLLANGACVNDMDYGGEAPMHNILKVVCYKVSHQPERIVRALLNHGSIRVWPGALPKVLKHCSMSPRTIEVLLNDYSHLKVTDTWVESVPPEVLKEQKEFYESIFSLAMTPRSLQHLARCRVRSFLREQVHKVVPKLDLPTFIKNYLLLEYRGYVH